MRERLAAFSFILSLSLILLFCSLAFATRSRLMGMGDLSIVIEDESNMINLWDFGRNPAAFLEDEAKSTVEESFIWKPYWIDDLPFHHGFPHLYPVSRFKADGHSVDNSASVGIRKQAKFAVSVMSNYLLKHTSSTHNESEISSPTILAVLGVALDSLTSAGVSFVHVKRKSEAVDWRYWQDIETTEFARVQVGLVRELNPFAVLGIRLGYDSFDVDGDSELSNYYAMWLSGQTVLKIKDRLKLGVDATIRAERQDIKGLPPIEAWSDKKDYCSSSLRFRGIYQLSSRIRAGLFFSNNELFAGFDEPLFPYRSPYFSFTPQELVVGHWGMGCSYSFSSRMLAAVEYHLRHSSIPAEEENANGVAGESLKLGTEARLSRVISLRGGYDRTETNDNPNYDYDRNSWQNTVSLGFGFESDAWDLLFDLTYQHAFMKFKNWYGYWDVKSRTDVLSFSLKKMF